jgi:hypothetical protein
MAETKPTFFQRVNKFLGTDNTMPVDYTRKNITTYNIDNPNVLFATKDKAEYDMKTLELRQNKLLKWKWRKANVQLSNQQYMNLSDVKMMYRDADLMDGFPELGACLDIVSEECTYTPKSGFMVNVNSKSDRIKSILQDLLVNRLQIAMTLPMVCRSTVKYGNTFMLLDIDINNGVQGWKQLPVYEVERYENMTDDNPYHSYFQNPNDTNLDKDGKTRFVWVGQNEFTPYWNWQIAHFRLLYDSMYLPYGVSFLNKARRHFRMLSMMEDAMLMYRLERAVERRVFKINVAAIDEDDVPSYIEEVANEFKRTPIVDPLTGQIDLRRNILGQMEDFFIPVRDPSEPNPIETLPAAQNLTALDDIKYVQNKICTALRVPKSFLNFEDSAGDGKNLSLMDVRFMRTVNRIQQTLLLELNKICIIHLAFLGFTDDLTNFTLTMNNPSSQAEMLELENLAKKITTAKDAITDNGNGIPLYSVTRAWKEILGWSEKEIADNLEELRLETALGAELQKTNQIIKRTHLFDKVDNIYGEPGAQYNENAGGDGEEGDDGLGGGGGGGIGGGFGGDMDMGGAPEGEDVDGGEGDMDMDQAAGEAEDGAQDAGDDGETLSERFMNRKLEQVLLEEKRVSDDLMRKSKKYTQMLLNKINEKENKEKQMIENIPLFNKTFFVNEELDSMSKHLENYIQTSLTKNVIND